MTAKGSLSLDHLEIDEHFAMSDYEPYHDYEPDDDFNHDLDTGDQWERCKQGLHGELCSLASTKHCDESCPFSGGGNE